MGEKRQERPAAARPADRSGPAREVEIKFRADKAVFGAVLKSPLLEGAVISASRELRSVYFDTAEKDLQRNGIALRIRRKARAVPVMSVKRSGLAPGTLFSREEVEVPCPKGMPDLQLFDPATREHLAGAAGGRPLEPVFEARVRRRVAKLGHGGSEIELALDEGAIRAGDARLPLCEVELELRSGHLQDLLECSAALAREFGLCLDFEAKSDRGYRLASGESPRTKKPDALMLPETISFDDLIAAVVSQTLGHFVSNWAVLRESDAPEAVHQLRVALRRMRSALGAVRKVAVHPELDEIRQEAKRIASALGAARECDVFRLNAMQGPLRDRPGQLKGAAALLEAVERRRKESYAEARAVLDDTKTSLFVLRVQGFVAGRAWRPAQGLQDPGLPASSGKLFAVSVLDRLMRQCRKRGRHLRGMQDEERHDLRIVLKNLRYAAEFFGSLFGGGKRLRNFLQLVAELQEDFGIYNDAATAQAFVENLRLPAEGDVRFAAGFLLGWYRHASAVADEHLLRKWKAFKKADVFWD